MAYSKQNFYTNQTLKAEHLNNIENGIVANETAIAGKQPKGNYATEEFVTTKISEASLNGNVDLSIYATKTEVANGYQPKGDYLTEHQKLKTINGQPIVGDGNFSLRVFTDSAINTLFTILSSAVYASDQSKNIAQLRQELEGIVTEPTIYQDGNILNIYSGVNVTQNAGVLSIA